MCHLSCNRQRCAKGKDVQIATIIFQINSGQQEHNNYTQATEYEFEDINVYPQLKNLIYTLVSNSSFLYVFLYRSWYYTALFSLKTQKSLSHYSIQ